MRTPPMESSGPGERRVLTDGGSDPADSDDHDGGADGAGTDPGMPVEELLVSAGVLEEVPDGTDLQLTDEFEHDWFERIRQMREGDRAIRWVATSHGADPANVSVINREGRFALELGGSVIEEWPSGASFLAGLVAEPTLAEWLPESRWEEFPEEVKEELVPQLMLFLEQCPACEEDLALTEETADDGSVNIRLACSGCGSTILEGATQ